MQRVLKAGLLLLVLGVVAQDVNAFGHCRWGRGCGGYAGCGYGYGGWGYGGLGYGSGYGGWGGWYSRFAGPVYGTPVYAPTYLGGVYGPTSAAPGAIIAPATASPYLTSYSPYTAAPDQVLLSVNVPADAKLIVNGKETKTPGEHRQFVSSNLPAGQLQTYLVQARFVRDGKAVTEERKIQIKTGQSGTLTFGATTDQMANTSTPAVR